MYLNCVQIAISAGIPCPVAVALIIIKLAGMCADEFKEFLRFFVPISNIMYTYNHIETRKLGTNFSAAASIVS